MNSYAANQRLWLKQMASLRRKIKNTKTSSQDLLLEHPEAELSKLQFSILASVLTITLCTSSEQAFLVVKTTTMFFSIKHKLNSVKKKLERLRTLERLFIK